MTIVTATLGGTGTQGLESVMADRRGRRNREAPRVSVIVPTRNEAANLPLVFSRLPLDLHEVIVVDGRSTDGTIEVARALRPCVRIVEQTGKGKGDALALGFMHATGDIIVTLDADGSADAAEIPRFVATLVAGADFAKGSRYMHGGGSADITFIRSLGNFLPDGSLNYTAPTSATSATATTRSGPTASTTSAAPGRGSAARARPTSARGSRWRP